jgi:hypothetical protein
MMWASSAAESLFSAAAPGSRARSTPPPVSQPAPAPVAALAPAPVSDQVDAGRVEPETKRGPFARAFAKLFGWFGRRPSHEPA